MGIKLSGCVTAVCRNMYVLYPKLVKTTSNKKIVMQNNILNVFLDVMYPSRM